MGAISRIGDARSTLVRVLVVDDFEPFRQFVCSSLQKSPELQVVGEASDGLEAVQKSSEILPDLIVLDIGLPLLNGIEAARRIRVVSPKSKILFVSQECSVDVIQEALVLGNGYIVKTHAAKELSVALARVRHGYRFIGEGVPRFGFADKVLAQSPQSL
jgi:DNA-binding NarL/FixJ family response regulator